MRRTGFDLAALGSMTALVCAGPGILHLSLGRTATHSVGHIALLFGGVLLGVFMMAAGLILTKPRPRPKRPGRPF